MWLWPIPQATPSGRLSCRKDDDKDTISHKSIQEQLNPMIKYPEGNYPQNSGLKEEFYLEYNYRENSIRKRTFHR